MSRSAPLQTAAGAIASQSSPFNGVLLRKCSCGNQSDSAGKCDACKEKEDESLHRKASGVSPSHEAPSIVHDVLRDHGRPLDINTRIDMEQRFGHDFAQVRVHTDSRASESARAVSALAYTVGQHVVFGANQYAPATADGRHLLAHELAHTVQQRATGERRQHRLIVREHESADERAADHAADIAVRGGPVMQAMPSLMAGSVTAGGSVQRKGGQLSAKEVEAVYLKWIADIRKARGLKLGEWPLELDQQLRERLKIQVGPGNYANFVRAEDAEYDKLYSDAEDKEAEKAKIKAAEEWVKNLDPVADQNADVEQMWKATDSLRGEVVRVEGLAKKLDFGTGVKGAMARVATGGSVALYGVGARSAATVSEAVPSMALGAAGTAVGSSMAEDLLVSQGQNVKKTGEEMGDDVRTAVRVVGGDMQAAYAATRPSYNRYWAALTTFGKHRSDFVHFANKNPNLYGTSLAMARGEYVVGMDSAMKDMREAGNEFLMKCAQLGIESDAKAVNKMGANVVKGAEQAVELAVTGPLAEVAPGVAQLKNALKGSKKAAINPLKQEVKEQVGKQVVKAFDDDAATAGAKKLDNAAGAGVKKADNAPAAAAKKVDDAPVAAAAKKADEAPAAAAKKADAPAAAAKKADEAPSADGSKADAPAKQPAPDATKSPKDAPAKIVPDKDAKALRDNLPNAKKTTDPKFLDEGYVAEVPIGKHTYRRHKDGAWCRFSTPICNLKVDPDVEKRVANWVEEAAPQGPARPRRPGAPPNTGHGQAARKEFDKVRGDYARQLGAKSGEDVHHAIELQALDRYPGVFSARELNGFKNMRGIPGEIKLTKEMEEEIVKRGLKPGTKDYSDFVEPMLGKKKQFHNSEIRDTWDRHYAQLNDDIAELGLKPGTVEYRKYVRRYVESARQEIDAMYEQFFTEIQRGKKQFKGAAR